MTMPAHILAAIQNVRHPSKKHLPCPPPGCCWWCHQPIVAKRRATWCSKNCAQAFVRLIEPPVNQRDNGICQICGIDTKRVQLLIDQLQDCWKQAFQAHIRINDRYRQTKPTAIQIATAAGLAAQINVAAAEYPALFTWAPQKSSITRIEPKILGFPRLKRQHAQEIDHIVPISAGGLSVLENLRTLCISCHERETRVLAGKRAYAQAKIRRRENKLIRAAERQRYNSC